MIQLRLMIEALALLQHFHVLYDASNLQTSLFFEFNGFIVMPKKGGKKKASSIWKIQQSFNSSAFESQKQKDGKDGGSSFSLLSRCKSTGKYSYIPLSVHIHLKSNFSLLVRFAFAKLSIQSMIHSAHGTFYRLLYMYARTQQSKITSSFFPFLVYNVLTCQLVNLSVRKQIHLIFFEFCLSCVSVCVFASKCNKLSLTEFH